MDVKCSSRRATTTRIPVAPALHSETKLNFQRKIKELQGWHEIPEELIINFDQMPLPCLQILTNVPLVGKGKKKQVTGTITITMSGLFFPMQLIYQGTTDRCLPKGVDFPPDFDVICTDNHWSNEAKAIKLLQKIVFPYVKSKRSEFCLSEDQKTICSYLMSLKGKLPTTKQRKQSN